MEEEKTIPLNGIRIGHAQDFEACTGCTVIICENGAIGGVDVRGGAPGTRETDLLNPVNYVDRVHAVILSGGSAFGLDAASGVMDYLEENNIGFDTGETKVPIVTGAVLYDLNCGNSKIRPDKKMGYDACLNSGINIYQGNIGAGTGATIGKMFGTDKAMKGGLGISVIHAGELIVAAVVAVNCLGDVVDERNEIIAGAYIKDPFTFIDSEKTMIKLFSQKLNPFMVNTTIGCVITNAKLNKSQINKVASTAHNGYARSIRPAHTMFDGDTIFALSIGEVEADINIVGVLASKSIETAVRNGVKKAEKIGNYLSYSDILTKTK